MPDANIAADSPATADLARVGLDSALPTTAGGRPLDDATQSTMGARFGHDFSHVRVYSGDEAADSARALDARAYTMGSAVVFGQGEYVPETADGQHLLAHELTHVVQQKGTPSVQAALDVSNPNDPAEREAEQVASRVVAGERADVQVTAADAIYRSPLDDLVQGVTNLGHTVAEGVGLETHDEAEAGRLQAFIDHGLFGPESLVPPTDTGGFDASFDPASGNLAIDVSTGVNFNNGLSVDASGVITANHTDLAQAAIDGMNLPPADRAAFVADFQWTRPQESAFLNQLRSTVESAWSGRFGFACTRPGWESLIANVVVDVDVHKGAARANDHLQTTVYKVPDSGSYNVGAFVDSDRNSPTNAADQDPHNNELVMSSTHVNPTPPDRSLLRRQVLFANDSAVLDGTAQATLNGFAADFRDANLDLTNPVELVGHASTPGTDAHNTELAGKRLDAVKGFLSGVGFTGMSDRVSTRNEGEAGATEDPEWRRVDLVVGSGEGQTVASHEFGHVFGLADEYSPGTDPAGNTVNPGGTIRGTGLPVGTVVGHDAMAKSIGTTGAVAENNDDIMSLGNTVRPKHYATFGWALQQVTGIAEWQVF